MESPSSLVRIRWLATYRACNGAILESVAVRIQYINIDLFKTFYTKLPKCPKTEKHDVFLEQYCLLIQFSCMK